MGGGICGGLGPIFTQSRARADASSGALNEWILRLVAWFGSLEQLTSVSVMGFPSFALFTAPADEGGRPYCQMGQTSNWRGSGTFNVNHRRYWTSLSSPVSSDPFSRRQ